MKIFKKILIVLAVLLLLISAIGLLFFPSHIHVERSMVINKNRSTVFNYANNLKKYNEWSPWFELDTTAAYTSTGPESGKGATMSWVSKVNEVGTGKMIIENTIEDSLIDLDLYFMESDEPAKGYYSFATEGDGTKMTWGIDFEAGANPMMRIMGKFMDSMVGVHFSKGLSNFKAKVEAMHETSDASIKVEEVKLPETNYLFIHGKANLSNIGQFLGESYGKMGKVMAKQKLSMAGAPSAIYYTESQTEWELDAVAIVSAPGKDDGDVKAGKRNAGNFVIAHFFGNYDQTAAAHNAAKEYITKNNKQVVGAPWEVYITDPMTEKDTAKWQTDVYYPIQ